MLYTADEVMFSAGAVVFDDTKDKVLTIVCTDRDSGKELVMFPKGRIEKDEAPTIAACREVEEEAGVVCRIHTPEELMGLEVRYDNSSKKTKIVYWYAAALVKTSCQKLEAHEEFVARWLGTSEAGSVLSFENDKKLLKTCVEKLDHTLANVK
ncbi:hypothetical protein LPJ72_003280 [Coemansia sp. Benny D160-2]|nr:hypothetical protein LPJ72_003280 [Coemansia sp. Benny D160-2]